MPPQGEGLKGSGGRTAESLINLKRKGRKGDLGLQSDTLVGLGFEQGINVIERTRGQAEKRVGL